MSRCACAWKNCPLESGWSFAVISGVSSSQLHQLSKNSTSETPFCNQHIYLNHLTLCLLPPLVLFIICFQHWRDVSARTDFKVITAAACTYSTWMAETIRFFCCSLLHYINHASSFSTVSGLVSFILWAGSLVRCCYKTRLNGERSAVCIDHVCFSE